jgi:hypothetical protein
MVLKTRKISRGTPYSCPTTWGASWNFTSLYHYIKNENVFQNPEVFPTQVSLSPKQSTLVSTVMQLPIQKISGLQQAATKVDCSGKRLMVCWKI